MVLLISSWKLYLHIGQIYQYSISIGIKWLEWILQLMFSWSNIALVKALFSIQNYWYFSYFSTKTYAAGTQPRRGASNEYPQHVFMEK